MRREPARLLYNARTVIGGTIASRYHILGPLGSGGMGTVYLTDDLTLNRKVALKFLKDDRPPDPLSTERLRREARAASALDHPNIGVVYDIGEWEGQFYIAMAYYPGETLRDRIARAPLTIPEVASIASQVASALQAAHDAGIVHRDVKPSNVMLTTHGGVRLLDFGLARLLRADDQTETRLTQIGSTPGTPAYMAPEQLRGLNADSRADVWAFGVMLYEMLAGRRPFLSDAPSDTRDAILRTAPQPLRARRADVPRELSELVSAALIKNRDARILTMTEAARICASCQERLSPPRILRTWRQIVTVAAALVSLVLLLAGWRIYRDRRTVWAHGTALPQVAKLVEDEKYVQAFDLASKAAEVIPSDPQLLKLMDATTWNVDVDSVPAGAQIAYREYGDDTAPWCSAGTTPIARVKVPRALLQWRAELNGYVTAEDVGPVRSLRLQFTMARPQKIPPRMVRASMGKEPFQLLVPERVYLQNPSAVLDDFLIDRYEVTNREFKEFVDAHGYQRPEYWVEPFVDAGGTLTRDEAMRRFVDAAGRPGPATWEAGEYPSGEGDYPVTGVSWYEASAYARFAAKMLPTVFHWSAAAEPLIAPLVAPRSNIGGSGLKPVGSAAAVSRFGTNDMAGNAKEWVMNAAGPDARYILGGGWNEPAYMFVSVDARSPFAREATFGFRCMKLPEGKALPAGSTASVAPIVRSFRAAAVSDEVFQAYLSHYNFDRTPLDAHLDSVDDTSPDWRLENVSFAAAYGHERVTAHLYLPKHMKPPFQTLVEFPGADAIGVHQFDAALTNDRFRFIVLSGRALLIPTYKGTYERRSTIEDDNPNMTASYRDHVVMWMGDLARSMDYLGSRADIRSTQVGYLGVSWGSEMGPIALVVEPRLKAGVFVSAGFYSEPALPEADPVNFAPRVKVPVLMLNGRFDFILSSRDSQEPMFRLLGPPPALKRLIQFDSGHVPRSADIARETLAWLDRCLGPVRD
jgi:formylglycine-generating enzyme required for sulfatase activity